MLERDLSEHAVLARGRRRLPVVRGDGVGAQEVHDEFVDREQFIHELPGVFAREAPFVDDRVEFVASLGPQNLEARLPARDVGVRCHASTLRQRADVRSERAWRRASDNERVISSDLARSLALAGLRWTPASGDAFRIAGDEFEDEIFTLSDMTIEAQEFDSGTVLGFNGTTEWALDSVELDNVLWMPREDQLRGLLASTFQSLEVDGGLYRVTTTFGAFSSTEAADAYGLALLELVSASRR